MPGFDPNEPRDYHGRWTDAGGAIQRAASGKDIFTVGYAPFREGNISNLKEGEKAFSDPNYKNWRTQGTEIARMMGIKILNDSDSIGVYEATSGNAEASRVIEIEATNEAAMGYGAIMGVLAPEKQHTVMVNKYDLNGDASEHYITFKNKDAAISFVENRKSFGIGDVSYFPASNKVLVLDFGNFDHDKALQTYGDQISNIRERQVLTRFIGENEYGKALQEVRNTLQKRNGGSQGEVLNSLLSAAEKRLRGSP